jgi:NADPH:quinone reductase-like Zn-dependent oxidoreductase
VINDRTTPRWGGRARELTCGLGIDHVIEVGGAGTTEPSIIAPRVGGRIALIGILTGVGGQVSFIEALAKHLPLQGLIVGGRRHQLEMIRVIEASGLQPVVDSIHRLDGLADAVRHQEATVTSVRSPWSTDATCVGIAAALPRLIDA